MVDCFSAHALATSLSTVQAKMDMAMGKATKENTTKLQNGIWVDRKRKIWHSIISVIYVILLEPLSACNGSLVDHCQNDLLCIDWDWHTESEHRANLAALYLRMVVPIAAGIVATITWIKLGTL
jgi:hypothetical protein